MPTALLTTLNYLNTTMTAPTSPPCLTQLLDLPVTWSIAGYVAVALAKILLSLIVIWVNIVFYFSAHRGEIKHFGDILVHAALQILKQF